jgi:hypothetical protein
MLLPWIILIQGCSVISINGLLQGKKWSGTLPIVLENHGKSMVSCSPWTNPLILWIIRLPSTLHSHGKHAMKQSIVSKWKTAEFSSSSYWSLLEGTLPNKNIETTLKQNNHRYCCLHTLW